MTPLIVSICLTASLFALLLSAVSLVLHYSRRLESPELTAVNARLQTMELENIDLMDKVKHWRNRDNVRRARQGAEEKREAEVEAQAPPNGKSALWDLAAKRGLGPLGSRPD